MDNVDSKQLDHLIEIEKKAEEILVDKHDLTSLDLRRNWAREGVRAAQKLKHGTKVWTLVGSGMVKMPKEETINLLQEDLTQVNIEISQKRNDLQVRVNQLRELEYEEPYKGSSLKPMNRKELFAIKKAFGEHS